MSKLQELLEIEAARIPHRCVEAVRYLERRWVDAGSPTEVADLGRFLDEGLSFCRSVGYTYPKVLLLRLKQIQRGEWRPSQGFWQGAEQGRSAVSVTAIHH